MPHKTKPKFKFLRVIKLAFREALRSKESAQRTAIGFGLGIFLGILPGTGPMAAVFSAVIFGLNRLSALLGSLLINTWINFVTFLFAIKIGSAIMGLKWQEVYDETLPVFKNFQFHHLLKLSAVKIILPLVVGYFIIALCAGLFGYIIALIIVKSAKRIKHPIRSKDFENRGAKNA